MSRDGFTTAELPGLLADPDVYVSASVSDGASLCLLEAMAAGAFPAASDIPANREWLTGGGDSLLFPVQGDEYLADCLQRTISDDRLRRSAIERNREAVVRAGDRDANMLACRALRTTGAVE